MVLSPEAEAKLVRRPDEPNHFMRIRPVEKRVRILVGDEEVASSKNARRVIEHGRDLYEPVLYVPRTDVTAELRRRDKTTHCPLKGDASYYDVQTADGTEEELIWSYEEPFDFSDDLRGLMAFDASRVTIIEKPV